MNKKMQLSDSSNMQEDVNGLSSIGLKGKIRAYDTTDMYNDDGELVSDELGEPIIEKENLIVLRGRTFMLEKLFDTVNNSFQDIEGNIYSKGEGKLDDRRINLFSCGNGGTVDLETEPFNPVAPEYHDVELESNHPYENKGRLPFIYVYTDGSDIEDSANQSHITQTTFNNNSLYEVYFDRVEDTEFADKTDTSGTRYLYYSKKFEGDTIEDSSLWEYHDSDNDDYENNEVYKVITLKIDTRDFREEMMNELGLYFSYDIESEEIIDVDNSINDNPDLIEMFSRITFDTESFDNPTKTITIEYMIYA